MLRHDLGRLLLGVIALPLFLSPTLLAQTTFLEVGGQVGFQSYDTLPVGFGNGVAAADFDDDGDVDLFVPTAPGFQHRLYRNLGNGQFEEVASTLGFNTTEFARVALWLDYDGDHRLDLLLASDCFSRECTKVTSFLSLYRQTDSGFVDVTDQAGLTSTGHTTEQHRSGLAAGDVNRDGYLDFIAGFWEGRMRLYLNQRDGTFKEESLASGLDSTILAYHQPVIVDVNSDGLLDIFAAIDFTENRLWMNQGIADGLPSFVESAAAAGCDNAMNDMGVAVGDFDEDGDPDFYVTNIYREDQHNILLRNDSAESASFSEVSLATGVRDGGWGWGTVFVDVDHDRDSDLAETNGWRNNNWIDPPRLFLHQGVNPSVFVDDAADAGLVNTAWASTLLGFDYDLDGDPDLVQTVQSGTLELYRNQLDQSEGDRHYLLVRPRMVGANVRAIGSKISVQIGSEIQTHWILAGSSYLGQNPAEAHFGLGSSTQADRVEIVWPRGGKTILENVSADQILTVTNVLSEDGFESGNLAEWSGSF